MYVYYWKIQTHKIYNIKFWWRNIKDEECVHHDAHFQWKLDSLKLNMAHIISLTLKSISGKSSFNRLVTFV